MAKEKMIELQLIKPVTPGTPGAKGKISLKNLFKEYLDLLQVPNYDPCCGEAPPVPDVCPPISEEEDNTIECLEDGLYVPSAEVVLADLISTDVGNEITLGGDGLLYSPQPDNIFPEIFLEQVRPINAGNPLFYNTSILYANPWPSTSSAGVFNLSAADFLSGGFVVFFGSGPVVLNLPDAADVATQLGTSDLTGWAFDYYVFNNDNGGGSDVTLVPGADTIAASAVTGGTNMVVTNGTTASFRVMGNFNNPTLVLQISRLN